MFSQHESANGNAAVPPGAFSVDNSTSGFYDPFRVVVMPQQDLNERLHSFTDVPILPGNSESYLYNQFPNADLEGGVNTSLSEDVWNSESNLSEDLDGMSINEATMVGTAVGTAVGMAVEGTAVKTAVERTAHGTGAESSMPRKVSPSLNIFFIRFLGIFLSQSTWIPLSIHLSVTIGKASQKGTLMLRPHVP
jgi:hypothetical protein